jgi:branched-chain amino acid transport system substrate-binding protein
MKKLLPSAIMIFMVMGFSISHLSAQEKTLKIGIMGPYTGSQASIGAEFKMSSEMALENIGYQIGDYKLEVVWIDDQCDPAKATNAYAEAVEKHGLDVSTRNWCSSVAVAMMDMVADYKIPHIFSGGGTELINQKYQSDPERYSYWPTKDWPVSDKLVVGYVDTAEAAIANGDWKPEKKTIAIYGEDTDWGRSVGRAMKTAFSQKGWDVVSEDYFSNTQTDFYSLLNRYRSSKVGIIAGTCQYPAMGALIKQAKEIRLKSLIIADGMGWVGNWYELTGSAADGVMDMIPQIITPEAKAWASKFEAKAGFKPSPSSGGLSYDGINIMIKIMKRALEKHGRLAKDTIHEVLKNEWNTGKLTYTRAEGAIIMNAYVYTPESSPDPVVGIGGYYFPVLQYDGNGVGHVIYPPDMADTGFKAP